MYASLHSLGISIVELFKSHSRLEAENLFLHRQLNIALRSGTALSSASHQRSREDVGRLTLHQALCENDVLLNDGGSDAGELLNEYRAYLLSRIE
jgi:hypothetical protein